MKHFINNRDLKENYPESTEKAMFGMGCFWGVEKSFLTLDEKLSNSEGIHITAVGYAGGHTANPGYAEVCTGTTNHNEVVLIVFDPNKISYDALLQNFWEGHDPTQGMRQGNDRGTQYRSGIYYYNDEQMEKALHSKEIYQKALSKAGYGEITTEILPAPEFYFAEEYHQQYLAKNPNGYCGLGGLKL
jgi:peptide-methionine (S)-S-oxide reductase